MNIKKFIIRTMKMRMKSPFTTSFGSVQDKLFLIVEAYDDQGNCGYGECDAFEAPWYTEETVATCHHMLQDFMLPTLLDQAIQHPSEVRDLLSVYRRNPMAKAAVETAIWDLYAKRIGKPLYEVIGGERQAIDVGVSIGLQRTTEALYEKIEVALANGAKRVKVKIKPGNDLALIATIRKRYPNLPLMVDANSAYTLKDIAHLKKFDQYDLLMMEQPLGADDILDHATLQKQLKTPICLDESICSLKDAQTAIALNACQIFNVKIARVGGIEEARLIHEEASKAGIQLWGGGMLEAGVGRAHSVALTTLRNFTLPADTSGSSHYFEEDIISPEVVVVNGQIQLPTKAGIGYAINKEVYEKYTIKKVEIEV